MLQRDHFHMVKMTMRTGNKRGIGWLEPLHGEPGTPGTLRLTIGKAHKVGAGQSMLSRLENDVLGNAMGLEALDGALTRATDTILKRKNKKRLIIDLDSTEDPAHGKQEGVACNGHFAKNYFHPLFCFTSEGDCLGARLRPGNVPSADGILEFIKPIVERYRGGFKLFWFRGDAAFANPETYEYCEEHRITYFIRLPNNAILMRLLEPHLNRPVGRPPKSGYNRHNHSFLLAQDSPTAARR
jgi:hypothetical protein